jgi:hypothetical protein
VADHRHPRVGGSLGWKARRFLEHGKCLAFTFAGLVAVPFGYDPGVPDTRPTEGNWT